MRDGTADVVVLGSLNTDIVIEVATLPRPGETRLGRGHRREGGGKGANQAVAAARAGAVVSMVGAVGRDDDGRTLVAALADDGIDVRAVAATATPTGTALIMVADDGENLIAVSPGANARVGAREVDRAAEALGPGSVLLCQLEIPLTAVVDAARRARVAGARVVINASPAPAGAADDRVTELLSLTDVLVVNRGEAAALSGDGADDQAPEDPAGRPQPPDWPERAAEVLRAKGCGAVVITLGSAGCVVHGPDGTRRIPALDVRAVDAVAAGDAFLGALACELAAGADLVAAARVGGAAGAVAVSRPGAQAAIPNRVEIDAALAAGRVG